MARRGATTRDPKKTTAPARGTQQPPAQQQAAQKNANRGASKWNRTGPGTYKDQYGNVLKGQKTAPKRDMSQRRKQPAPPNEPPPNVPFDQLTSQQQINEMADVGGNIFNQMAGYTAGFNPETFQQQYDPVYSQEMERARQNIMSQFDRRNQRQFEQQRTSLQQQIAERGLDPASPAAQELMRQQNERETFAQQEAMSAAEQAADARQQQIYGQAVGVAQLPGQLMEPYQTPGLAQYGQLGQEKLKQMDINYNKWAVKNTPRGGGGGGGGADPYAAFNQYVAGQMMSGYGQQQRQPNLGSSAIGGIASGASQAITGNILRQG